MIKLYYATIKNLTRSYPLAGWQEKKAAVYKRKEDYLRSVAASLLINAVLFDGLPAPAPSIGTHGKPYFPGSPDFNLSHSGDFAVLAAASMPVGIDIEQISEEDYLSVGRAFLCEYEYRLLEQTTDKCTLFYELWTRKESYLKMTGTGLLQDPKSFCALRDISGCNFFIRNLAPGYAAAICSADTACAQDFIRLDF